LLLPLVKGGGNRGRVLEGVEARDRLFASPRPREGQAGGTGDHPLDVVGQRIQDGGDVAAPEGAIDVLDLLDIVLHGHDSSPCFLSLMTARPGMAYSR